MPLLKKLLRVFEGLCHHCFPCFLASVASLAIVLEGKSYRAEAQRILNVGKYTIALIATSTLVFVYYNRTLFRLPDTCVTFSDNFPVHLG